MIGILLHDIECDEVSGFGTTSSLPYTLKLEELMFIKNVVKNREDVALTFDDGGVSIYYYYKDLIKIGITVYVFLVSSKIGKRGFLSIDQIHEMYNDGVIFGGHSVSHPMIFSSLNEKELNYEVKQCIDVLYSKLGIAVDTFSIPGGDYNYDFTDRMRSYGIKKIFVSDIKIPNEYQKICIPRIIIKTNFSQILFKLSIENRRYLFYDVKRRIKNQMRLLFKTIYIKIQNEKTL